MASPSVAKKPEGALIAATEGSSGRFRGHAAMVAGTVSWAGSQPVPCETGYQMLIVVLFIRFRPLLNQGDFDSIRVYACWVFDLEVGHVQQHAYGLSGSVQGYNWLRGSVSDSAARGSSAPSRLHCLHKVKRSTSLSASPSCPLRPLAAGRVISERLATGPGPKPQRDDLPRDFLSTRPAAL